MLNKNYSGHYTGEFSYISLCGHEKNYVHCDDLRVIKLFSVKQVFKTQ